MSKIVKVTDKDYDSEEYEILSYLDLIERYSDKMEDLDLSDGLDKKIVEAIFFEYYRIREKIKLHISFIFQDIIANNYIDEYKDLSYINNMIKEIAILENIIDFDEDFYNKEEICKEVYQSLKESVWGEHIPDDIPEEFLPKNLCDINYQFKKFYEKNKNHKELEEYFKLNSWRLS